MRLFLMDFLNDRAFELDASVADSGMNSAKSQDIRASALSDLLDRYSTEVTPGGRKSIDIAEVNRVLV